jgi:hypothetical protein
MITEELTNTNGALAETRLARSNDRWRLFKPARAALLLGAALCATAIIVFAAELKNVRGGAAGTVSVTPGANDTFIVHFAGTGTLTHIGRFAFVLDCPAKFDSAGNPSPLPGTTGIMTTPNGEQVFFATHWSATRNGDQIHATGTATAHGGTGRFAQITAGGEFITLADLDSGQMSVTFAGTVATK